MEALRAVLVDGAAAWHMERQLFDRPCNLPELFSILAHDPQGKVSFGKVAKLAFKPMITVESTRDARSKSLRSAGFDTVVATSKGSRDDDFIISAIDHLDEAVTELVILSADQDYVEPLRRAKARNPRLTVYWVATKMLERGRSTLSVTLQQLFARDEFEFVELAQYHDRLSQDTQPWRGLHIDVNASEPETYGLVISEMTKLQKRIPGFSYKIARAA